MSRHLKIAAAQYPLTFFSSQSEYREKIEKWVEEATKEGAQLLVFPEYGAMELASLAGKDNAADLQQSIDAVSDHFPLKAEIHSRLATQHNVTILGASGPMRNRDGTVTNVARLFAPGGKIGEYHKLMPTPWERDSWGIASGPADGLTVFDLGNVKVGLVICYDIEFPLIARALVEAGADIILAPSNTETEYGYWRVRTGAMARALEGQIYTVQSPTVGPAPWCTAVDQNYGAAGIFAPSDQGLPAGGVIALGEANKPQWVIADLDLSLLETIRAEGGVQIFNHWKEQPGAGPLPVAKVHSLV